MNENLIVTFYHEYPEKKFVISYLSNYVRNVIRESDKTSEEKEILLSWPIIYAHAWKREGGEICIYIGETNNLVQRIGQHAIVDQDFYNEADWHEEWLGAIEDGRGFSWFFGSKEMNKSMCLDLEQSLVRLLGQCNVDVKTKAVSEQIAYSNKNLRDKLIKEIWENLVEKIKLKSYDELDSNALTQNKKSFESYSDSLEFRCIKPKQSGDFQELYQEDDEFKNYPMVYLYLWKNEKDIFTYVGETEHFDVRNEQHLRKRGDAEAWQSEWNNAAKEGKAYLFTLNHREFNKSMTMDIENRLINYTTFIGKAKNLRHNEQGKYSNQDKMFGIFEAIINKLLEWQTNKEVVYQIFQSLETVRERCVSLASPFYQLTSEQAEAKNKILEKINTSLDSVEDEHTLLVVYGGAGTGKTVLISALLFALIDANASCKLVVNNKELAPAYQNMIDIWKLGCDTPEKGKDIVYYASDYLKKGKEHDVLLIDEGHLLNIVEYMRAKSQLKEIVNKARITVLVFDPLQFIDKHKMWKGDFSSSEKIRDSFIKYYEHNGVKDLKIYCYELKEQQRMRCAPKTQEWILNLATEGATISCLTSKKVWEREDKNVKVIEDDKGYWVAVCREPLCMKNIVENIRKKDKESLMIATYDWEYDKANPKKSTIFLPSEKKCSLRLCWHKTGAGALEKDETGNLNLDSWIKKAENDEVGAVHDIQGFDLNYAIVIIGPSIQYSPRRGKDKHIESGIQVNTSNHKTNHNVQLILNELRVLLTRGSKGLIIYATDEKLRNTLYNALKVEE